MEVMIKNIHEKREVRRGDFFVPADKQSSLFRILIVCFPRANLPNHLGKFAS
jgi:hypothetical protein